VESPSVLVVMPLYNAFPFVRAALESILAQTYQNYILLVINDGSTDGSEQEVVSLHDRRMILWNQENQGPGAAMNGAIKYALDHHIPFLARMDADDISLPQRLETQLRMIEKNPALAACSANCLYINSESGQIIGSATVSSSPGLIRWEITHGLRGLIQPVCFFRTSALAAIGGYRLKFKLAEEVDVFLRLADQYELRNCSDFLCKIRIRPGSLSLKNVHQNILYQFYALDCAKNRNNDKPERDFGVFSQSMSRVTKFRIWREEHVLKLWRDQMHAGRLSALILASLLDPRRVIVRGLRKLTEEKYS
jgi:glycosyltransferase involved in cell wall biosynthesis